MIPTERPAIYMIRHGETHWNAEKRLQGQRDTPLNDRGSAQAREAGDRLRAVLAEAGRDPCSLDYVASPLERTCRTMEGVRTALGLDPAAYRTDPRLKELAFGRWEGLTWKEIRRGDGASYQARDRDKWRHVAPGEGGESYALLVERIAPVLADVSQPTVIVAHGGVARAALVALGHATPLQAPRIDIWQGRVMVLDPEGWRWA